MIKPRPTLEQLLAEAITTLTAMADDTAEMTPHAFDGAVRAYYVGAEVSKRRQFRGADHPIHAQLARIEEIVAGDRLIRDWWESRRQSKKQVASKRHTPHRERG